MDAQWLFPFSALSHTPSKVTSGISLYNELFERAKGVEFIYRVAAHLQLTSVVLSAAAHYFHRFYMRYSFEDYPRQEVAAASLFLATKTEENSRKLRDVSYFCFNKATGQRDEKSPEIQRWQKNILATEETLLDALCFDFTVDHPQAHLIKLLEVVEANETLHQYAWTSIHDSFRTPLCILYSSRIIAAACFVLAQRLVEGPNTASLDERIFARSSASLPTPPHMYPHSPQSRSFIQDFFYFSDLEMEDVAIAVSIILDFYSAFTSAEERYSYIHPLNNVSRPTLPSYYRALYANDAQGNGNEDHPNELNDGGYTPASMGRSAHHSEHASPSTHTIPDQNAPVGTTSPNSYDTSSIR